MTLRENIELIIYRWRDGYYKVKGDTYHQADTERAVTIILEHCVRLKEQDDIRVCKPHGYTGCHCDDPNYPSPAPEGLKKCSCPCIYCVMSSEHEKCNSDPKCLAVSKAPEESKSELPHEAYDRGYKNGYDEDLKAKGEKNPGGENDPRSKD